MKKIAFFDRDGTINVDPGYVHKCSDLQLLPGVQDYMKMLVDENYEIVIVTNQSGIARGYFSLEQSYEFTRYVIRKLRKYGVTIKKFITCPHHEDGIIEKYAMRCKCRKPLPGMITGHLIEQKIDPLSCLVVGNKISDLRAGYAAGLRKGILIGSDEKREVVDEYFTEMRKNGYELRHHLMYPKREL